MTMDSPVVEQIKPVAGKVTRGASKLINSFSFEPHPTRRKLIMGVKVGIPALIAGMILGRRMRSDS